MQIKQSRDICIDKLTSTSGEDLEIMANLTSSQQAAAVVEVYVAKALGSQFGVDQYQMLLRLTVSWQGRGRDDLTGIGKSPEVTGYQRQESGNSKSGDDWL